MVSFAKEDFCFSAWPWGSAKKDLAFPKTISHLSFVSLEHPQMACPVPSKQLLDVSLSTEQPARPLPLKLGRVTCVLRACDSSRQPPGEIRGLLQHPPLSPSSPRSPPASHTGLLCSTNRLAWFDFFGLCAGLIADAASQRGLPRWLPAPAPVTLHHITLWLFLHGTNHGKGFRFKLNKTVNSMKTSPSNTE